MKECVNNELGETVEVYDIEKYIYMAKNLS
jgi:hypothetical protein